MATTYSTENSNVMTTSGVLTALAENVLCDASAGPMTITLPDALTYPARILRIGKVDSSVNPVLYQGVNGQTISGQALRAIVPQWESVSLVSLNGNWLVITNNFNVPRLLAKPIINLKTANSGDLFQVPAGLGVGLLVTEVVIESTEAMTGVLASANLKLGTAPNYNELLGSGGMTFNVTLLNTILPLGATFAPLGQLSNLISAGPIRRFPAGSLLRWNVTGGLATGAVRANLFGVLD